MVKIVLRNAAGHEIMTLDEAMPRFIHGRRLAYDFDGSFSVPDFDSNRGMFFWAPCVMKVGWYDPNLVDFMIYPFRLGDGVPDADPEFTGFGFHDSAMPTLAWNNATKVMTVTPSAVYQNWWWFSSLQKPTGSWASCRAP